MCISYVENESRNTSRKFTQNALLDLPGFEIFFLFADQGKIKSSRSPIIIFDTFLMCSGLDNCAHGP